MAGVVAPVLVENELLRAAFSWRQRLGVRRNQSPSLIAASINAQADMIPLFRAIVRLASSRCCGRHWGHADEVALSERMGS
jgi:hypothetical protein